MKHKGGIPVFPAGGFLNHIIFYDMKLKNVNRLPRNSMNTRIKIAVCGNQGPVSCNDIIIECLNTIEGVEIDTSQTFQNPDVIYWVSPRGPSIKKYFLFWIKKNPLIINHWIGTDVITEIERKQQQEIRRLRNFFIDCVYWFKMKRGGLIHLASAPWLVDELSKLHIPATYVPITSIDTGILGAVNSHVIKDIDFFSYVPFERFSFYGGNKIVKLAKRWPNYRFLIICPDLTEIPADFLEKMPENIQFSPRVERDKMPGLYQRSKFFIRYTQHDGLSVSVLEALYFNLEVLWTHDFPGTYKIETLEKLSDSIPSLVKNWHPNENGHAYVIENFSVEKWRANFLEIIQSKLHQN